MLHVPVGLNQVFYCGLANPESHLFIFHQNIYVPKMYSAAFLKMCLGGLPLKLINIKTDGTYIVIV